MSIFWFADYTRFVSRITARGYSQIDQRENSFYKQESSDSAVSSLGCARNGDRAEWDDP